MFSVSGKTDGRYHTHGISLVLATMRTFRVVSTVAEYVQLPLLVFSPELRVATGS